jgi:hypothetical protein
MRSQMRPLPLRSLLLHPTQPQLTTCGQWPPLQRCRQQARRGASQPSKCRNKAGIKMWGAKACAVTRVYGGQYLSWCWFANTHPHICTFARGAVPVTTKMICLERAYEGANSAYCPRNNKTPTLVCSLHVTFCVGCLHAYPIAPVMILLCLEYASESANRFT